MATLGTNYHGLHEYSTFSSSTIKNTNEEEGEQQTNCFCFLCRLSESLILHPVGPFRCCWDLFVMVLLIYTSVEIPYTVSFGQSPGIQYIGLFVDCSLLFDIFLNFHTAYFDKYDNLRLVTNKKYICKKYFRTWFFVDFLTSIPFEFIFREKIDEDDDTASKALLYIKILRIFRLLRIIKILRFVKMLRIFDAFMKQFIIREVVVFMKLFKVVFGMLMFAHFAACLWWFVGSRTQNSWIDAIEDDDGFTLRDSGQFTTFQKYSFAWYWAVVTLFTTGYGDIVATNTTEQWVCSICILIGTCFFAYFVGTLTVLITEGDKIKSYELEKLEEAQSFCEKKKLPKELTRAILTHIRYHCTYNYVFDETELLNILPSYLQHDIHTYVAKQYLQQINIFQNEYIHLPDFIIGLIAVKCRSISCNQSYKLYDIGDFAKTFYIQRTGRSTMYDKNGKILHELARGSVCGEFSSILFKRRRLQVQCKTWSEFYSINIDDIKEILDLYYPKSAISKWKQIKRYIKSAYNANVHHSVDINNLFNYECIEGEENVGFNAPSMHSMFSFNKNNTNMSHHQHGMSHEMEPSVHLFNNVRPRNNSNKTNSDKRSSGTLPIPIHIINIVEKASSPIPPQTPITPQPQEPKKVSFDNFPRSEITIITADLEHGNSEPITFPKLNKRRARSFVAPSLGRTTTPGRGSNFNLQRISTPKLNKFAKKLHMRSNSEIRDIVVVTHAEKHKRLATPKNGATPSPGGTTQRISDLFRETNDTTLGSKSFRKIASEPVFFGNTSMEMKVLKAYTSTREGPDDAMIKSASIRSGYSSFSHIEDSECSFDSIQTDHETESDDDHKVSRHNTEERHHPQNVLAKKKQKKKERKTKKKKKGKGKFGGRGRSGGGGPAAKQRRSNMNKDSGKVRSRSPKHQRYHKQQHNNGNYNNNIRIHKHNKYNNKIDDNEDEVRPIKGTKMFIYDDRNRSHDADGYEDTDNERGSRQTSIDPSVLLAPLSTKQNTVHTDLTEDSMIKMNSFPSKDLIQNIQNINININGTKNENVFVMSPEYADDESDMMSDDENEDNDNDEDIGIIYDDDGVDKDVETNVIKNELKTPGLMPIIKSNVESV